VGLGKPLREDLHLKRKRLFPLKPESGLPEDGIYQRHAVWTVRAVWRLSVTWHLLIKKKTKGKL